MHSFGVLSNESAYKKVDVLVWTKSKGIINKPKRERKAPLLKLIIYQFKFKSWPDIVSNIHLVLHWNKEEEENHPQYRESQPPW